MVDVETVVIGGGAMGAAAAWSLARAGRSVLLLERFGPRHDRGASHGDFRNFNLLYAESYFQDLLVESDRLWRELEAESDRVLIDRVGMVGHGGDARADDILAALRTSGFRAGELDVAEATARWPGIRFDGRVVFAPDGGRVRAWDSVEAFHEGVARHGGEVRYRTPAVRLEVIGDDEVAVTIDGEDGPQVVTAKRAIVTVGAWTSKVLGALVDLPQLAVFQVQPAHFPAAEVPWPSFRHIVDSPYGSIYGLLEPGRGVKIGWHGGGVPVDPDARRDDWDAEELAALRSYVRSWMPGLDAERPEMISCTYTMTPTSDFVLDRVGPVVVGAGFSGQGFKFTPAIGASLAGLATGDRGVAPEFRIAAHVRI
ncbi:FAD-dependent oxidoreductase [Nakamurella lactea]|uniref:FAD-dependent oxidoreductase n=1 Tax=Nakamurella lactea TaxID=459515 RepID=UPI0003F776D9|nr:FAD-dependent oxidoreductase [Nakamurella lactea]